MHATVPLDPIAPSPPTCPLPARPCSYAAPRVELLSCSTNGALMAAGGGDKVLFWDRRTQVRPWLGRGAAGAGCSLLSWLWPSAARQDPTCLGAGLVLAAV